MDFLLWGRIEQTATAEFIAIATAVRADASSEGLEVIPYRAFSRHVAEELLKGALLELGERVRAKGHIIIDVETDGV